MIFNFKKDKSYYCCKCLEETVILHHDWYAICSMYGHPSYMYRPLFEWKNGKFDYKKFLKVKKKIIENHKKGRIHKGCVGCKDLEKREWTGKCDKIYHIHFRLSKKCNAKCIYCSDATDNISPDRLFFNDLKKLVEDNKVDKNALMEFGGGEMSLHDEFEQIVNYLVDRGFHNYKFYTSCLKYSPAFARALSFGGCDVIVSSDAGDRETFIKMKRADTYDRLWGNLKKYVEAQNENKYQVKSKSILVRGINDSEEQIDAFLAKSKEIGIKEVRYDIETDESVKLQIKPDNEVIKHLFRLIKYSKNQAENVYGLKHSLHLNAETLIRKYPDLYE